MAIRFRDFLPAGRDVRLLGLTVNKNYKRLDAVLEEINAWVGSGGMRVVSVETVLLPAPPDGDTASTSLRSNEITPWLQVVRVWYDDAG